MPTSSPIAADERIPDTGRAQRVSTNRTKVDAELLDVHAVAGMLGVSSRHVWRLADRGAMPPAVRLGGSVRWSRRLLEQWIAGGCEPLRGRAGR